MVSFGRRLLLLLPVANLIAAGGAQGTPVSKRGDAFVLSTGERLSLSDHGSLLIRQGRAKAFVPLPGDVADLLGVDEETTESTIVLRLGRECPPGRRLTITHEALRARLMVATEHDGQGAAELASLRTAVGLAPDQTDLRLKLVHALLTAGKTQEAAQIFSEGMRVTPFEMSWLARQGNEFAALITKLPAAKTRVDFQYRDRDREAPSTSAAWSRSRRLAAFVDDSWRLHVVGPKNAETFLANLALGLELDELGQVIPAAQHKVAKRVAAAEEMLAQLGFASLPTGQFIKAERNEDFLSWVCWKAGNVIASAGNTVIRVRRGSKVVFKEKIDTMGVVALDWGFPLPEEGLLLLAWSRVVGNDTCPNGTGIVQVPLPAPPR